MTGNVILDRWNAVLAGRSAEPAVYSDRGEVLRTFADVESGAGLWGRTLAEFPPRSVIAIQIGNHAEWPSLLLACWRLDLVVLPMERSLGPAERDAALEVCGASGVFEWDEGISLRRLAGRRNAWGEAPPVLLKLTSGTTAAPRAIRFRAHQLLADCENICATKGLRTDDLNYGVIPVSHSYGFSNLLSPLLCRGIALVMSADRMPRAILEGLAATRATIFPGTPVYFQALAGLPVTLPLPTLRLCISAGASLPPVVARSMNERFGLKVHTFYGSSECGGICYDASDTPELPPGYVGRPMHNVHLTPLDGDEDLRIAVESGAVGDDYHPHPEPDRLGGGRFIPGDLVRISGEGVLLVGRASDVINVAGCKLNPLEVESHLLQHPAVRAAVVFGIESSRRNEEVVACVAADSSIGEGELQRHCRTTLSPWQIPKVFWFVDEIPVNERGKINRRESGPVLRGCPTLKAT